MHDRRGESVLALGTFHWQWSASSFGLQERERERVREREREQYLPLNRVLLY